MASCLMELDHYLDQCRLIIREVPWYSPMVLSCISSLKIILSKLSSQLVDINTLKALNRRCREKSACHYITCKFHAQSCSNSENNHFIPSVRVNWVTIYYFLFGVTIAELVQIQGWGVCHWKALFQNPTLVITIYLTNMFAGCCAIYICIIHKHISSSICKRNFCRIKQTGEDLFCETLIHDASKDSKKTYLCFHCKHIA